MNKTPASTPTRTAILKAANHVVLASGVSKLTLEAVAAQAGVSKGGLLYHFPSKQALIEGMVADQAEDFATRLARALDNDTSEIDSGRWLRAYARAAFAGGEETISVSAGLLAAVANDPDLLRPLRENFARWQEFAESDGLEPAPATVIRLAVEGLWFADLFGFAPPTGELRDQILEVLVGMATGSE